MGEDDGDKKGGTLSPYGRREAAFYHAVVCLATSGSHTRRAGMKASRWGIDKRLRREVARNCVNVVRELWRDCNRITASLERIPHPEVEGKVI